MTRSATPRDEFLAGLPALRAEVDHIVEEVVVDLGRHLDLNMGGQSTSTRFTSLSTFRSSAHADASFTSCAFTSACSFASSR